MDPDGVFIDYSLGCSDGETVASPPGLQVETDPQTPENVIRAMVTGLLPDDVIEQAGYAEAPSGFPQIYRVTRDGQVIASFIVRSDFIPSGQVCPESGLSLIPIGSPTG